MKYLWKNKILIALLLLLVILFPSTISTPQQSRTENIVTAVGIDKIGDEYEVSIQYVIPYADSAEGTFKMSSAKGKTVGEAVETLSVQTGRLSGFAHCRALLFNQEASEDDMTSILDYFIRIKPNTNNIVLLYTKKSSKDTLSAVKNFNGEFYTILNANGLSNDQRRYQEFKNIGDYYNAFFSPSKCIGISVIDVMDNSSQQGSQSSGGSSGSSGGSSDGGGSSSGSGQSSNASSSNTSSSNDMSSGSSGGESGGGEKKVFNAGEKLILKDAKKVALLDKEQSSNLSFFNPKIMDMSYSLEHFSDELCKDVSIIFDIHDKGCKVIPSFVNGVPHYTLDLTLNMRTTELSGGNVGEDMYYVLNKKFSDTLKQTLKDSVTNNLRQAEQHFKQYKYDVIKCYETFYKFKNKEFKQYLSTLPEGKYFMEDISFDYKVTIIQQL
ncbi:MAG: Ger(x)C family spore germination C-terminal domain-containing protein [Christensenellales bacterium]